MTQKSLIGRLSMGCGEPLKREPRRPRKPVSARSGTAAPALLRPRLLKRHAHG